MTIDSESIRLLTELAAHLAYDSGVNGSKFGKSPFGRLALDDSQSTNLWARILDVTGLQTTDTAECACFSPVLKLICSKKT